MASWQPVQVTYKASVYMTKEFGKRQVSKGAHSIVAAAAVGGFTRLCYLSYLSGMYPLQSLHYDDNCNSLRFTLSNCRFLKTSHVGHICVLQTPITFLF